MSKKTLHLIYGIVLSFALIVAGLLLIAACIQIYRSGGEQIYTPEKVAVAFAPIALPIYLTLALVVGGFALNIALPLEKKRAPMEKQYTLMLQKAYEKADMTQCDPELQKALSRQQKLRRTHWLITLILLVLGMGIALAYGLDAKHYHEELAMATDSVIGLTWYLLPCTAIPFGYGIFCALFSRSSIRKELDLAKQLPKAETPAAPADKKPESNLLYIRLAILVVALGCLLGGFVAGGTADVLAKAVAICTECVGLG